jgi:hypothetical protein
MIGPQACTGAHPRDSIPARRTKGGGRAARLADEKTFSVARHLPGFHRTWFKACFLGIAGFLGLHASYGLPPAPLPIAVTTPVGFLLFAESVFFFALSVVGAMLLAVLAVLGTLGLFARRARPWLGYWFETRAGARQWAFRPWLHSVAWTILFLGHMALDIHPYLTGVCLSGVLLLLPEFWAAVGRVGPPLAGRHARVVSLGMGGLWWVLSPDAATTVAVVFWSLTLFLLARPLARVLALRDRFALSFLCIPAVQLIATFLPLTAPAAGGRKIGEGMAYSFCEEQRTHRLFAVVPRCSANQTEKCRQESTVDELDARTLELVAQHRFFSDRYAGRLEQLVCLEDRVQVGMDYTVVDGRGLAQNLLEFPLDRPGDFTSNALGDASGDGIAWDRRRGAVFYRSHEDQLIRRDLRSGRIDRDLVKASGDLSPIADIMFHEKRDSLFVLRSHGSIVELNPKTFTRRATYPMLNAWEFTIDEERDRLYVAGSWGMEVIDLPSRRVIRRAQIGFGGRRPAVDRRHDLIYVPSTAAGRLQVFDRQDLSHVGTIPLGMGVRFPYVSEEHDYVLATSQEAYYAWNATTLARRLRGEKPER